MRFRFVSATVSIWRAVATGVPSGPASSVEETRMSYRDCLYPRSSMVVAPGVGSRMSLDTISGAFPRRDVVVGGSSSHSGIATDECLRGVAPMSFATDQVDTDMILRMLSDGLPRVRIVEMMRTSSAASYTALCGGVERELHEQLSCPGFMANLAFYAQLQEYMHIVGGLSSRPTHSGEKPFDLDATLARTIICPFMETESFRSIVYQTLKEALSSRLDSLLPISTNQPYLITPLAYLSHICPVKQPADLLLRYGMLYDRVRAWVHEQLPKRDDVTPIHVPYVFKLDLMLELLAALPSASVVVSQLRISYLDGPRAAPLRDWFRRLVSGLFDSACTSRDKSRFLFIPLGDDQHYYLNPKYASLETYRTQYYAVGRLLAMSLIEGIPIARRLSHSLLTLLVHGPEHQWTLDDLYRESLDSYRSVKRVGEEVKKRHRDGSGYKFMSLDGSRELIPGGALMSVTPETVAAWTKAVIVDYMYLRFRVGMDAIRAGFYSVVPDNILTDAVSASDLGEILHGRDISDGEVQRLIGESIPGWVSEMMRDVLVSGCSANQRRRFVVLTTGMVTVPVIGWLDENNKNADDDFRVSLVTDEEARCVGFDPVKREMRIPVFDSKWVWRSAFEKSLRETDVAVDRTESRSTLMTLLNKEVRREAGRPVSLEQIELNRLSRWTEADQANQGLALIARNLALFQSANMAAFRYMGGFDLLAAFLRGQLQDLPLVAMSALMTSAFLLLGEYASRIRDAADGGEIFLVTRMPGASRLCEALKLKPVRRLLHASVRGVIRKREEAFANVGFRVPDSSELVNNNNPLEEFPFANIPKICRDLPSHHVDLKMTVLFNRLGRAMYHSPAVRNTALAESPIPFDFEIENMLKNIANTPVERLRRKLDIKYIDLPSFGSGVYKDWFHRVWQKLLSEEDGNSLFVFDNGVYRINPKYGLDTRKTKEYTGVGRLLALSVLDSMPIGRKFNLGLFWVLIEFDKLAAGGTTRVEVKDSHFEADNKDVFFQVTGLCEDQKDSDTPLFTFVSIDESNTELIPGGKDIDLTRHNADDWMERATLFHMFGRNEVANRAIATGFYEVLPPDLFSDDWMTFRGLASLLQGHVDVATDELLTSMRFVDFTYETQQIVQVQLREVLEQGGPAFRTKFLIFVTGLTAIPQGGLRDSATISVEFMQDATRIPEAHTCFNQIRLPVYQTEDTLKAKLETAFANSEMSLA